MRPEIRVGDVVRLSHRGMSMHRRLASMTMTVIEAPPCPQDGRSRVRVAVTEHGRITKMSFRRKELWRTGYNIFDQGKSFCMTKQPAGQPRKQSGGGGFSWGFSMSAKVTPKKPDPCKKDEVKCSHCERMADRGHACWWCGWTN